MCQRAATLVAAFLAALLTLPASVDGQVIVSDEGDTWHYLRGRTAPPVGWAGAEFDPGAAGWEVGVTGIGYGDDDDATVLDDMVDQYLTVYLRTSIVVPEEAGGLAWRLHVRYDDGFVAYVDGEEVARRGLAGTPPAFDEGADPLHEITAPTGFDEVLLLPGAGDLLGPGEHVLAVEVHNATLDSSDLSFSARLEGLPLVVSGIDPSQGPVEGGGELTITGLGFRSEAPPSVRFGEQVAGSVEVVDESTVRVTVPPAPTGVRTTVDVTIDDGRGAVVLPSAYRYLGARDSGLGFDGASWATSTRWGDLYTEGTIELWLLRSTDSFFQSRVILAVEQQTGGGDALRIDLRRNRVRARYYVDGDANDLTANVTLPTGAWLHLAFAFGPAGRRLYLDGALVASDDLAIELPEATALRVGGGFAGSTGHEGMVESLRIWSVERTESEVRRLRFASLEEAPDLQSSWLLGGGEAGIIPATGTHGGELYLGDAPGPDERDGEWVIAEGFPALAIASVEPASGAMQGGNTVVVWGGGFDESDPPVVEFGGTPAPSVEVTDEWRLEVVAPAGGTFASVSVAVRSGEQEATLEDGYEYVPDGFETLVEEGDEWWYLAESRPAPEDWAEIGFNPRDDDWLTGPTGIGYGDEDDATDLSSIQNTVATVYARVEWELPAAPADVVLLTLRVRFDDGYVAYLNGREIAREGVDGTPPTYDELASISHEIEGGAGTFDREVDIPVTDGLLAPGTNVLAVEVHNTTLDSSDLSLSAELDAGWIASTGPSFLRGDVDRSGRLALTDAIRCLRGIFLGEDLPCEEAADCDDDGRLAITDAVYLVGYLFQGGPEPPPPYPDPGPDSDADPLGCRE